MTVVFPQIQSW